MEGEEQPGEEDHGAENFREQEGACAVAADGIVTPAYGRAYAEHIPGARFELIAAAGHVPQLEQPDAFVACVARFLGER